LRDRRGNHVSAGTLTRWTASTAACRVFLVGVIILLIGIAYYPFHWDPPRVVDNQVTRAADGALRFGEMNYARTPESPPWLPAVRASGTVQIALEVNPQFADGHASMMMLADDFTHSDFGIQQYQSYLLLWLNRPGSTVNGDPPFAVPDALTAGRWTRIDVVLHHGDLRIDVDGTPRLSAPMTPDALSKWGSGRIALGDEVDGGVPWQGQIRLARVNAPGYSVDYAAPGALAIPRSFLFLPDHLEPFPPVSRSQWSRHAARPSLVHPGGLPDRREPTAAGALGRSDRARGDGRRGAGRREVLLRRSAHVFGRGRTGGSRRAGRGVGRRMAPEKTAHPGTNRNSQHSPESNRFRR
jgi:hypothetical protein